MEKEVAAGAGLSGYLAGLLVGMVLGIGVGLLIAPQPGKVTRERIRGTLGEAVSVGKSAWEEGKETAAHKRDELQARLGQAKSQS